MGDVNNNQESKREEDCEVSLRIIEDCDVDSAINVNIEGVDYIFDQDNTFKLVSNNVNKVLTGHELHDKLQENIQVMSDDTSRKCLDKNFCMKTYADTRSCKELQENLCATVKEIAEKYRIIDRLKGVEKSLDESDSRTVKDKVLEKFQQLYFEVDRDQNIHVKRCNLCKKCFTSRANLCRHFSYRHSENRSYACKCNKRFVEYNKLLLHLKNNTDKLHSEC